MTKKKKRTFYKKPDLSLIDEIFGVFVGFSLAFIVRDSFLESGEVTALWGVVFVIFFLAFIVVIQNIRIQKTKYWSFGILLILSIVISILLVINFPEYFLKNELTALLLSGTMWFGLRELVPNLIGLIENISELIRLSKQK
jgi:hypothetical protein